MDNSSTGFLPYRSDAAPHNVEEQNCSIEKSEPMMPI